MINLLPFAGIKPTKAENGRLEFVNGEARLSITKLEHLAINRWLANLSTHSLPVLLTVGSSVFTLANSVNLASLDYIAALKDLKENQLGTEKLEAVGTHFFFEDAGLIGNPDSPVYLRLREGSVETVMGFSVTTPDGVKAKLVEEAFKTAVTTATTTNGGGSIPVLRRSLTAPRGDLSIEFLMESFQNISVTVYHSTLLDQILDLTQGLLKPVTFKTETQAA